MKAAIYNPYWDTLGGGERYTASLCSFLLKKGYRVDIEWKNKKIKTQIKNRFGIDLSETNILETVNRGDGYDLCFWVSDGSVPTLKSRNNILHFQFPFREVNGKTLINRMKFFRIKSVVVNSNFTKKFIDKEYGVQSKVVYPPVDVKSIKPKRKENLICYVGRFSQLTQSKNQHILVDAFKKMYDSGLKDWKLVLAGGVEIGASKSYMEKLKSSAKAYPISFLISPSYKKLIDLYAKSKIFWSASGYKVNEESEPLKVEHFGITPVEAMAAKAIPIIVNSGGHKEIIVDAESGYLWNKKTDLINKTKSLIENKKQVVEMAQNAQDRAENFSIDSFEKSFEQLL